MVNPKPRSARSRLAQPEGLDDLLLYRLSHLLATAGAMVIRLCEGGFGITRREWRVIAALGEAHFPVRPSDLADRIQLDRARTSRAVTSLVAKGLLQRETGASDRREALLSLTPAGREVHGVLMPAVQGLNRELLSVLPAADVQRLDTVLTHLTRQASAMVARAELPKADRRRGGRNRHPLG